MLKTTSPATAPACPNESPRSSVPSSRTSFIASEGEGGDAFIGAYYNKSNYKKTGDLAQTSLGSKRLAVLKSRRVDA